jgi:uncharacterized protein (DUF302 family)
MEYTFGVTVHGEFDDVVARVTDQLGKQGFGVLSDIDVQATLKAKLDVDRSAYRILGACNPPYANQALQADPEIGALLPCNVIVRQDDDGVRVACMDPAAVLSLVDAPAVAELAAEVRKRLEHVVGALG